MNNQVKKAIEREQRQFLKQNLTSSEILELILEEINPVDFLKLSGRKNKNAIRNNQKLVITVDSLLEVVSESDFKFTYFQNECYLYNLMYWDRVPEYTIKDFLGRVALKMELNKFDAKYFSFKDNLCKQFTSSIGNAEDKNIKNVSINLMNGTFEISKDNQKLRSFNPEDFIRYQLGFSYTPDAPCKLWQKFLDEVLPEKELQVCLAEHLGAIFIRNSTLKLEKALLVYGTGANGKSVVFEVVNALLGETNISSYSIQSITDSTGYHRAKLSSTLVNYSTEMSDKFDVQMLKILVSGEPTEARLPFAPPFIMKNYCKFIFNCNELPKQVEQTDGYFRRFNIIPFRITIPENKRDKDLSNKIIKSELAGVFNWVIAGAKRIVENGSYSNSQIISDEMSRFRTQSDNVRLFVDECECVPTTGSSTSLTNLYETYTKYCKDAGYHPLSKKNFSSRLKTAGFRSERRSMGMHFFIECKNPNL